MLHELACADSGEAFHLWRKAIGQSGAADLVHAAVLAANAHNSQPWRFTLSDGMIDVHADLDRHLGSTLQAAFVFRAGYPTRPACLSPRRPLDEIMDGDTARPARSMLS
jgi:hypothetical protein